MFVTDPPISHSLKSVNMLIIMGMLISLRIWLKPFGIKEKCCVQNIPGHPVVCAFCYDSPWCSDEWTLILTDGYIILVAKVYFLGVNYEMFIENMQ